MRKRLRIIPIVSVLALLLCMAAQQLIAGLYYRMAQRNGQELNKTIEYLEECTLLDDRNPLFHFSLGRVFLRKGLAEATNLGERSEWIRKSTYEFHKAIELDPLYSDYHFHLGMSYGFLGYPSPFYGRVIQESFGRTALLSPTDVRHLYSMGIYYLGEYVRLRIIAPNREGTSSVDYRNSAALAKENYQLYFRKLLDVDGQYLGKILKESYSVTQRYADLRTIIRDTPHDHALFARFLDDRGMWKEAKGEYEQALKLEPTNPIHYSYFAHSLFRKGYYERAIYWWQKQKALNPQDGRPYLFSADSFIKLKQFNDALRELRDLTALYPENINYQVKLTRTLMAAGRIKEAIHEYSNIMEKDPNLSKDMYDSIRYYQRKGNYLEATRILNQALSSVLHR